jgi:hypothetical protein
MIILRDGTAFAALEPRERKNALRELVLEVANLVRTHLDICTNIPPHLVHTIMYDSCILWLLLCYYCADNETKCCSILYIHMLKAATTAAHTSSIHFACTAPLRGCD